MEEKIDGSCVAIARHEGKILPLVRAGYHARSSEYQLHHMFASWVESTSRSAIPAHQALSLLGPVGQTGFGVSAPEGCVWRVENEQGGVEFLGKFVRQDFTPGKYFEDEIWLWNPPI